MQRLAFVLLIALLAPADCAAAPEAELWPKWQAHVPGTTATVDHVVWDRFLAAHVVRGDDGINRIAYRRVATVDRQGLADYIEHLAATRISGFDRPEQRAFWINLYNALTVQVVLDHYPVDSIRDIDISPGLFADGPWGRKLVSVEGEALSLDDIEHRILRPIWRDPRLHYALNCSALGCPDLQPVAFTAANADGLLEAAARAYVNHPRGVRVDGETLYLSKIYSWYPEDFEEEGLLAHVQRYATPTLAETVGRTSRKAEVDYDWALNDAR
jgi:Protein of unknown function, DUF547